MALLTLTAEYYQWNPGQSRCTICFPNESARCLVTRREPRVAITEMVYMLQGLFEFRFQLVYTSLEEQLVKIKELWDLALRQKGKERDVQKSAKQRLNAIIQASIPRLPAFPCNVPPRLAMNDVLLLDCCTCKRPPGSELWVDQILLRCFQPCNVLDVAGESRLSTPHSCSKRCVAVVCASRERRLVLLRMSPAHDSDGVLLLRQAHEESEGFNPGWLEDENERIVIELPGSCVSPLCSQPGRVALTATRIYFQPFNISSNSPVEVYQLNKACSLC